MAQMLTAMELPQMQDFLTEKGFLPDTILTAENYEDIVSVFLQHWDVVESAYADSRQGRPALLMPKSSRGVSSAAAGGM